MITVEDVIKLALPPGTTVVAGRAGLGREVTWAARIRSSPPAFGHLAGGELVILPVAILAELDERLQLDEAIRRLAELGVAGAAVLGTIGKPARDAAEAAGLPLLALPKGADIGALERDAARLITERRREVQHRGQEVLRLLMDLAIAGEPLGDVVRELARISGRPVALEGRDGRLLVYHAAGKSAPSRETVESIVQRDRPIVARWLRTTAEASPADPPTAAYELDSSWSRVETGAETNGGSDPGKGSELQADGMPAESGSVASEVILCVGPENRPTAATELLRSETGDVHAGTVTMERAGAEHVTAERIVMINSGARTIDARSAQVDRSGILAVRSDKAVFYNSTAIAVAADEARIVRGRVLMLKAERATIEGDARIAIYAGPASDSVRPLVDVRGAAAFGAGLGAVLLLLGSVLRRIFRVR